MYLLCVAHPNPALTLEFPEGTLANGKQALEREISMRYRCLACMGVPALLIAAVSLAPAPANGQAGTAIAKPKTTSSAKPGSTKPGSTKPGSTKPGATKTWTPPRTPDG